MSPLLSPVGAGLLTAGLLVHSPEAQACDKAGSVPHQVDPSLAAVDTTPPTLSAPVRVQPNVYDDGGGCGGSSCAGLATINLHVAPLDDRSPVERIGYRLTAVAGVVPPGIPLPSFDTQAFGNMIVLPWSRADTGQIFSFQLAVAPIDEAGNVGAAQNVLVKYDEGGGCAMVGKGAIAQPLLPTAAAMGIAAALLACATRRRRARPAKCQSRTRSQNI